MLFVTMILLLFFFHKKVWKNLNKKRGDNDGNSSSKNKGGISMAIFVFWGKKL